MQLNLNGKIALVTGSSKGIGKAIATKLHSEGCKLVLNARNIEQLNLAKTDLSGAIAVAGDVTQIEEARRIVSEVVNAFGSLDILVCNVGSGKSVPPGNETYDEWQRVFALNLWSTTNIVESAKEALISSKGVIVCISSICGIEVVPNAPVTYSAAKAALHAYVKGTSRPLGKQGVRINAIAPGNILFDNSVWSQKLAENEKAVCDILKNDVSLGTLGEPSDVANLVAFLASSQSKFASGGIWTLDGGQIH